MNEFDRDDPLRCPDAELLAAWSEGGLGARERSRLEEHAATCGRCQAQLAALARMAAADAPRVPQERGFRLWPWLVPAAGAAAAVTVWVMVQQPAPRLPEPPRQAPQVQAREEADRPMAVPAPTVPPPPEAKRFESRQRDSRPANPAPQQKVGALAKQERRDITASVKKSQEGNVASEAPAAAAPAAPPAAQSEAALTRAARAADASAIGSLVVHRSPEGRVTWETQPGGISARLTAGASPSPSIIWLVGKDGLVLLSTDSRSWKRVPFPESVDLAAVDASSDTTATVTTADARVFATSDGGLTWQRK